MFSRRFWKYGRAMWFIVTPLLVQLAQGYMILAPDLKYPRSFSAKTLGRGGLGQGARVESNVEATLSLVLTL